LAHREHDQNHQTSNSRNGPYWYSIGGLAVLSEVGLPLPVLPAPPDPSPTWTIRYGKLSERLTKPDWHWPVAATIGRAPATPNGHGQSNTVFYQHYQQAADGFWFWWDSLATVHVSPDSRTVEVFLEPDPDYSMLGSLLAGPLAAVILGQLGYPILHASAVATPAGAVAFLGRKGHGKSTIAASFLRRGASLLTDDMLLLRLQADTVCGVPGPPIMRLWKPTVEQTLGLAADDLPDVATTLDKKVLWIDGQYSMVKEPTRLIALYFLDRYELSPGQSPVVSSHALSGTAALTALLAQTYHPVVTAYPVALFLPTFVRLLKQARVRTLHYPTGFELQEAARQLVLQEVMAQ
jgi:hypothetical protein